ncbi:MAG: valine--tRNA ligase [Candidatus Marinimicrobia bacterium]|nr:valine--tRNA ligase [Candidatus Neomarinimicrobiota bacterium]
MTELDKVFSPGVLEKRWYDHWQEKGYFHAEPDSGKQPYTIVIPPPNVTGILTMGHVLNNTIQDVLIRKARMEGFEACWIPGTDHASIATESKVMQMLQDKNIEKDTLSREEFLKYSWDWKEKYGGIIIQQLKKLGCSCDWEREKFTMDDRYSNAVLEAFVRLHKKGLVYRGYRLVNWCPASQSAISDEEVIHREVQGSLWTLSYPLKDKSGTIEVATTRPETMLGDTAVAVHPKDDRYRKYIGQKIELPLTGRIIPIVGDEFVDPDFGTGCVKVTPAHDPNDFEIGKRHDLDFINIMNPDASLNDSVPEQFKGLTRENARKQVIERLKSFKLISNEKSYTHSVGFSERGGIPIEYYLSEQWYLKMEALAEPAIKAIKDGDIKFHPPHWVKTYDHWMENIKDWCISRQLWWGHQIPVWYKKGEDSSLKENIHVSVVGPKDPENWRQDKDVLDTWASSWIWPFGVHDWPESSEDLDSFYPTNTLVTGPDIIFFWVARMIMAGCEFMEDLPFKDVYFTSILRDDKGRKLSKSLGNSPDPLDLIEQYGADAVRFSILLISPQGVDVLFSPDRMELGRNFMNKLWNAARFVIINTPSPELLPEIDEVRSEFKLPEKWIISRLNNTIREVNRRLNKFQFNEAVKVIYDFTWSDYCDWMIEISKISFYGEDKKRKKYLQVVAVSVLKQVLCLLHPFVPFITEELWHQFCNENEGDIILSKWPDYNKSEVDEEAEQMMDILKEIITSVRSVRNRMGVPPSKKANLIIRTENIELFENYQQIIQTLGSIDIITMGLNLEKPPHSATIVVRGMEIFIPLEGLINFDLERTRLKRRKEELTGHYKSALKTINSKSFLEKAPVSVVENKKKKLNEMNIELEKLISNLEMLN